MDMPLCKTEKYQTIYIQARYLNNSNQRNIIIKGYFHIVHIFFIVFNLDYSNLIYASMNLPNEKPSPGRGGKGSLPLPKLSSASSYK